MESVESKLKFSNIFEMALKLPLQNCFNFEQSCALSGYRNLITKMEVAVAIEVLQAKLRSIF